MQKRTKNIFDQNRTGGETKFAHIVYKQLMSGVWVTHTSVMEEFKQKFGRIEDLGVSVSNSDQNSALKKAFPEVIRLLKKYAGKEAIVEEGPIRNRKYRYAGTDMDPLKDFIHAAVIKDIQHYYDFCQDSSGLLPVSWLKHFFENTYDLLDFKERKQRGEEIIGSSLGNVHTNIELLPIFYEHIKAKHILRIAYKDRKGTIEHIFHPHYLKEYNGRWQLFGHAEGLEPEFRYNLALDRIVSILETIEPDDEHPFHSAPEGFYSKFFEQRVGVSVHKGFGNQECELHIRANDRYMWNLITSKKFHPRQQTVTEYGHHDDSWYGEVAFSAVVNDELIGKILQMGEKVELVSPLEIRSYIATRIGKMNSLYQNIPESKE